MASEPLAYLNRAQAGPATADPVGILNRIGHRLAASARTLGHGFRVTLMR